MLNRKEKWFQAGFIFLEGFWQQTKLHGEIKKFKKGTNLKGDVDFAITEPAHPANHAHFAGLTEKYERNRSFHFRLKQILSKKTAWLNKCSVRSGSNL